MIRRRQRRDAVGLNTSSTADISFMLLIFFLLVTAMDTDKGLMKHLPAIADSDSRPPTVAADRLLRLEITADDAFFVDGVAADVERSHDRIAAFIRNGGADHLIEVDVAPTTTYDAYFRLQDCIVTAYQSVHDSCSMAMYGVRFAACTAEQRTAVRALFPQRLVERCGTSEKGGSP